MINQYEMPSYVHDSIPELDNELEALGKTNPYSVMRTLLDFTSRKAKEQNLPLVKKSFEIADKLYTRGNNIIRNAVENVYVYSLEKVLHTSGIDSARILAIIPMTLYTLYIKQACHRGY